MDILCFLLFSKILFVDFYFFNCYLLILEAGKGEGEREIEKEREKHQFVVPLIYVFTG